MGEEEEVIGGNMGEQEVPMEEEPSVRRGGIIIANRYAVSCVMKAINDPTCIWIDLG